MRRLFLLTAACLLGAAACSTERETIPATTSTVVESTTTTTAAATTTTVAATTTLPATTTTTTPPTTAEPVVGAELTLSAAGLGNALFGADADGVVAYVNAILGAPTTDSGWVDPTSTGGACPGTEIRFVTWADLTLFFSDESTVATAARHFVSYTFGPQSDLTVQPNGPRTANGATVGSTVGEVQAAYPGLPVLPGDEISPPGFVFEEGLFGYTTGASVSDVVVQIAGGFGCGE